MQRGNNRWKWMAGATAVSAAAATSTQANTVTVTLINDFISTDLGNHLSADVFGDGHNLFSFSRTKHTGSFYAGTAKVQINTFFAHNGGGYGKASFDGRFGEVKISSFNASTRKTTNSTFATTHVTQAIPIRFSDPNINGGAVTDGLLTLTATVMSSIEQELANGPQPSGVAEPFGRVSLDSFMYNQNAPSGVPDQGSTLALLALGAGGLAAFRRRKIA